MDPEFKTALEHLSAETIVERLESHISERRRQRIQEVVSGRIDGIHLALECPSDINNALAALRTAEALGIANIHLIQAERNAANLRSITQGAFYWINRHYYSNLPEFLTMIKNQNMILAGGTVSSDRVIPLNQIPVDKPICLLLGNEQRGLSPEAHEECEIHYRIPMFGMSESLNLSVSAAISLYDTTTRKRELINNSTDLNSSQQLEILAQYYFSSLDPRLTQALLSEG